MKLRTVVACLLLVAASVAPVGAAQQSSRAYAGAHVSFQASSNAVTEYAVANETMLSRVEVQSQEKAEGGGLVGVGVSLSAITNLDAAALSVEARAEASARLRAESGATLTAHDNHHGVLVVAASGESQYVVANVSAGATASAASDSRVVVTTDSGQEGTFFVVGNGTVTVNDDGDVTAKLGANARLVFRAYPDGRDSDDRRQEKLIASGKAAAEVYVMQQGGETVTDTVSYASNTTVEVTRPAESQVRVTVDRATHEGTVVVTSVSKAAVGTLQDVSVSVSGDAAVRASSYSALTSAIGSDQSKFMVAQRSSARAQVLVAVNHFSTRTMTIDGGSGDGSDGTTTDDSGGTTTSDGDSTGGGDATTTGDDSTASGGQPGFGAGVAVASLLAAALLAARQS